MTMPFGHFFGGLAAKFDPETRLLEQDRRLRLGHADHIGNRRSARSPVAGSSDARRNTRKTSRASSVSSPKAVRMNGIWDGPRSGRVGIVWVCGAGAAGWVMTRVAAAASMAPAGQRHRHRRGRHIRSLTGQDPGQVRLELVGGLIAERRILLQGPDDDGVEFGGHVAVDGSMAAGALDETC